MPHRRLAIRLGVVALAGTALASSAAGCGAKGAVGTETVARPAEAIVARAVAQQPESRPRVLFIRGADGTAPASGPANPDALSDITNLNAAGTSVGFGALAKTLADAGYDVSQLDETGTVQSKTPVDLAGADLTQYKVVIFGSNNATYDAAGARALADYVANHRGGVLFMSDTNWGNPGTSALSSDNALLTQFGITMNQDNGQPVQRKKTDPGFVASHSILQGVDSFSENGTSACSVTAPSAAITVLVNTAPAQKQTGTDANGDRILVNPTANDGALVVADTGAGRVACLDDRDEFVNPNLDKESNKRLAVNLVNWLAGKTK